MPKLVITLFDDGSIKAEGEGFKGSTCEEASAFMEKLFGEAASRKLKDSYHMVEIDDKNCLTNGYCG
jgi:hypothetical protein